MADSVNCKDGRLVIRQTVAFRHWVPRCLARGVIVVHESGDTVVRERVLSRQLRQESRSIATCNIFGVLVTLNETPIPTYPIPKCALAYHFIQFKQGTLYTSRIL